MSGLEILGACAAAQQFAVVAGKTVKFLHEIYTSVKEAPDILEKRRGQLEQFHILLKLVETAPGLANDLLIKEILDHCLEDAGQLNSILERMVPPPKASRLSRAWKTMVNHDKEKANALMEDLEKHRNNLLACIVVGNANLLYSLGEELVMVRTSVDRVVKQLPALRNAAGEISILQTDVVEIKEMLSKMVNQTSAATPMVIQGIFLVPYPRNPHFVGRKSHLDELVDGLENIGGISYRRRAIFGLGGVGKTQIVMEYAFGLRQRAPKTSVFWVHGSTSARFEQSYVEIAKQANIKGIDDPNKDPKILVKEWLCRKDSGTWLMIVDNADNCEIFFPRVRGAWRGLAEYLPKTANGSIIFTTRDKTAGLKLTACGPKGCIEVKKMEEMDCMSLLRTRMDPEQPFCETEANELLKLLDYLPLAVVQATAFMAENQIGLKDYLYLYQESPDTCIELLSHDFEVCDREGLEIPNAVTHTWMISFKEIQKRDTKAVELLSFLSCLDRQGICAELLPQMKRLDLVKARGVLLAFSLITFDQATETISMHRLVHIATRGWLQQEQKLSHWIKVALDRLAEHFPPTGEWFTNLTLYASTYLPHVEVLFELARKYPENIGSARRTLLSNISAVLKQKAASRNDVKFNMLMIFVNVKVKTISVDPPSNNKMPKYCSKCLNEGVKSGVNTVAEPQITKQLLQSSALGGYTFINGKFQPLLKEFISNAPITPDSTEIQYSTLSRQALDLDPLNKDSKLRCKLRNRAFDTQDSLKRVSLKYQDLNDLRYCTCGHNSMRKATAELVPDAPKSNLGLTDTDEPLSEIPSTNLWTKSSQIRALEMLTSPEAATLIASSSPEQRKAIISSILKPKSPTAERPKLSTQALDLRCSLTDNFVKWVYTNSHEAWLDSLSTKIPSVNTMSTAHLSEGEYRSKYLEALSTTEQMMLALSRFQRFIKREDDYESLLLMPE